MRTIATSILSALIVTALSGRLNAQSGDTFGYSWTSSDQGGIAFNWTDIKSIGTRIIGLDGRDDANDGPFPIGFSFPYYGAMYDSFRVCSNGFITFYNQSSAFSNYGLPDAGEQEMIAPFWNDLNLGNSSASHVYYYYDGTRLIVQFYVIPPYSGTGNYTFQVILYPDGRFVYQYLDMNGSDKTATIGWQNTDGSDGFTISLDDPVFVHNNLAIQVKYGPKAPSNLIAVGGDQIATLTWDQNIDTLLTVSHYRIYGGTSPNPATLIDSTASASDTSKIVTGLLNDVIYYFRVTAVSSVGDESGFSNQVSAYPSVMAELFVTNKNDAGTGSLRSALLAALSHAGPDTIRFEYSLKGSDITLTSGGLTMDADGTVLDGDVDLDGKPDIGINGSSTFGPLLTLAASNSVIKGLVIHGYYGSGGGSIYIGNGSTSNLLVGNYIGTNLIGDQADGRDYGVYIASGATNNLVGDGTSAGANVISGNNGSGIYLESSDNSILKNYIGTDAAGTGSVPNSYGIEMQNAVNNVVDGNVISGNNWEGVYVATQSSRNTFTANYIGTAKDGLTTIGNGGSGMVITRSDSNLVGDGTAGGRNIIGGNASNGIYIDDGESRLTVFNRILGNYIGIGMDGMTEIGNSSSGIAYQSWAYGIIEHEFSHNTIAFNGGYAIQDLGNNNNFHNTFFGNSIYSNTGGGIVIYTGDQQGLLPPVVSTVTANSASGTAAKDALVQLYVDDYDQGETLLDTIRAAGDGSWAFSGPIPINKNVTALQDSGGNTSAFSTVYVTTGDSLLVSETSDNGSVGTLRTALLYANYHPGPDSVKFAVPLGSTIYLTNNLPNITDSNLTINGDFDQNGSPDLMIMGGGDVRSSTDGLRIYSSNNVIRGLVIGNCLATDGGVILDGPSARNNLIVGNYLGTDLTGLVASANTNGVALLNGASLNRIGDGTAAGRNVISGNNNNGIFIMSYGPSCDSNVILGNYVGLGSDGQTELGNGNNGINLYYLASFNEIGDGTSAGRNVISGNGYTGIMIEDGDHLSYNRILGNYIGTDASGTSAKGNNTGVQLYGYSGGESIEFNMVGDGTAAGRNIIAGNSGIGLSVEGDNTHDNMIAGNYIGLNASGQELGNGVDGILLYSGSSRDTVMNNVISGNGARGVAIINYDMYSNTLSYNVLTGNLIGTNPSGTAAIPNGAEGLYLEFTNYNTVGDGTPSGRNIISGNGSHGISLAESNTDFDVSENIFDGNYVGVMMDGVTPLANGGSGIHIQSTAPVGQPVSIFNNHFDNNTIANNVGEGIYLDGEGVHDNTFFANSIYYNGGQGIFIDDANGIPQYDVWAPRVDSIGTGNIAFGKAVPGALVQVYKNGQDGEGQHFYDTTYADGNGIWSKSMGNDLIGSFLITALQDSAGNTSEFSQPFEIARGNVTGMLDTLDFGNVAVGDSFLLNIYGVVSGNGVIMPSGGLDFDSEFKFISGTMLPDTLFNGDTIQGVIRFKPSTFGSFSDTNRTVTNSNQGTILTVLRGAGVPGVLASSSTMLNFGTVLVGDSSSQNVRLYANTGAVLLDSSLLTGTSFTVQGLSLPHTLLLGDTLDLTVKFKPSTFGSISDSLLLFNNSSSQPVIYFSGSGGAGTLVSGVASVNYGTVYVGDSSVSVVAFYTSVGQVQLNSLSLAVSDFVQMNPPSLPMIVGPGDTVQLQIKFIPSDGGAKIDTLRASSNGNTVSVPLTGNGLLNVAPNPFSIKAIAGRLTNNLMPTLSWQNTGDPNGDSLTYDVVVSSNSDLSNPVFTASVPDSSVVTSALDSLGLYYYQITARDPRGDATASNIDYFRTDGKAPVVAMAVLSLKAIKKHVQVYVATSEVLTSRSISFNLNGTVDNTKTLTLVPGQTKIYQSDYDITSTGSLAVTSVGTDSAGNVQNTTKNYTIASLSKNQMLSMSFEGLDILALKGTVSEDGYLIASVVDRELEGYLSKELGRVSGITSSQELIKVVELVSTSSLNKNIELKVGYEESLLGYLKGRYVGFDERKIGLYREEEDGSYSYLTGQGSNGELIAKTNALGRLVVLYDDTRSILPESVELSQNYPNPFNPTTTIRYGVPQAGRVKLVIYNVLGQVVSELVNTSKEAGYYEVIWNGRNRRNMQVSSGIYLYRLETAQGVVTRKMTFLK